jgi:serine kinase
MEYCELGNLYTYQFTQSDKIFKLNDAIRIFIDILKGVNAIHKENIIHRDIKCENILLKKKSKNQGFICKIGDFGFAKSV